MYDNMIWIDVNAVLCESIDEHLDNKNRGKMYLRLGTQELADQSQIA